MTKSTLLISLFSFITSLQAQNWNEPKFHVGTGLDTTIVIIDFQDSTIDRSYYWTYAYSAPATAEEALRAIDAEDDNLNIQIDSSSFGFFLQSIYYNDHKGEGGMPNFWSTWDGTDVDSLETNLGLASPLISGGYLGCSYTDFNPALKPEKKWAAYNGSLLSLEDINQWLGQGTDSMVTMIDFGLGDSCLVWGILFDDSITSDQVLQIIDQEVGNINAYNTSNQLSISRGIKVYTDDNLFQWKRWRGTNIGNWKLSNQANDTLKPGDYYAFTYREISIHQRPQWPSKDYIGLEENKASQNSLLTYPNPTTDFLNFNFPIEIFELYTLDGKQVLTSNNPRDQIDLRGTQKGLYIYRIYCENRWFTHKLIIR